MTTRFRFALLVTTMLAGAAHAADLPSGASVGLGSPSFTLDGVSKTAGDINGTGTTLGIGLNDANTIVNWNSFDIASGKTVAITNGTGGGAAILNRVIGGSLSSIDGSLTAPSNVAVYLFNPNGLIITSSGSNSINVGSLVASTLGIADADFADGGSVNLTGTSTSSILSIGSMTTTGGPLVLVAQSVTQQAGFMTASGDIAMVAATDVTMNFAAGSPLSIRIDRGTALNGTAIRAAGTVDGRNVYLAMASQSSVTDATLRVDGSIAANTVSTTDRGVVLSAGASGGGVAVTSSADTSGVSKLSVESVVVANGTAANHADVRAGAASGVSITGNMIANGDMVISPSAAGLQLGGGLQAYEGDISIYADTVLTNHAEIYSGGKIDLQGSVNGGRSLTADAGSDLTISGAIGGTTALSGLDLTAGGLLSINNPRLTGSYAISGGDFTGINIFAPTFASGSNQSISITDTAGGLTIGSLTAPGALAVRATNGGSLTTSGALASTTGTVTLAGAGGLAIGGNVTGTTVSLASSGGAISQSAGVITATTLTGSSNGATTLGQTNAIQAINGFTTTNSDLSVKTGNSFTVGNINTGTGTLDVDTSGDVTQSSAITVGRIAGDVGGVVTLTNASNAISGVNGLAAAGNVQITTAGAFNVAGEAASNGGDLTIRAGGALTIGSAGKLVAANTVAASTAGTFTNQSGADAIEANGHWVVYASTPVGSSFDGLDSGTNARWNATIATAAPSSFTGNKYVFALQPTLTLTTTDLTKTYGDDISSSLASALSVSGLQAGVSGAYTADTLSTALASGPTVTSSGAAATASVAGSPYAINVSATAANGYALTLESTGEITVNPYTLNATLAANDKTYDGSKAATGTITLASTVNGDVVNLSGVTLEFADKNVGTGKTVTATGGTLSSGNYTLGTIGTDTADIGAKSVTATAAANDKIYDGNAGATGSLTLAGTIGGDDIGAGATFAFTDKNVGPSKTVNISGAGLTGNDAGNYTLTSVPATTTAAITAKSLDVIGTANNKVYDGNTATTGTISLSGVVTGDTVTTSGGSFAFADENAGTGKSVTLSGVSLGGGSAGNYTIGTSTSSVADITPKALTATLAANDKIYDGGLSATGTTTLVGTIGGDDISLSGVTLSFGTKGVGTSKAVTASGGTLAGADAGNYTLSSIGTDTADITAKPITGTASANDKIYDGATGATGTIALGGVVAGDSVTGTATFSFSDKDAGTGKTVNVTSASLAGTDSGNYVFASAPANTTAAITPKSVTVTATANDKVYDGTVAATGSAVVDGLINGDDFGATGGTYAFVDENAGTGKAVTVTGLAFGGADAGNYTVTGTTIDVADITPKALAVTANVQDKVYDGTTAAQGSLSVTGVIAGDSVTVSGGTLAFADKNAGTNKAIQVAGVALSGGDAGNYSVATTASGTASITPRAINATIDADDKVYDGTTAATGQVRLSGVLAGDNVQAGNAALSFADKNVGSNKTVTLASVTLNGADANNYRATGGATGSADITPRALTATVSVDDKTYDGTTTATGRATLSNAVAGDDVTLTGGQFAFADANAGVDKTVSVSGLGLSGGDAANYSIATPENVLADILRRAITVTVADASKTSGTADPAFGYGVTQGSLVSGDSLTGNPSRDGGETPGRYVIGQGSLSAGANYVLTVDPGTLIITPNVTEEQMPQPLRAITLPSQVNAVPDLRQPLTVEAPLFCAASEACGQAGEEETREGSAAR